jgi:hypothetical protein
MPQIPAAIPTQAFELIRNRIAEILVDELPEQAILQGDNQLNATVYVERFIPFDLTEIPAVNVSINRTAYSEQTQRNTDGEHTFSIDVHTSAKSTSTVRGDSLAMFRLQKLLGVVRGILEDSRYKTLGFAPPFIESRKVTAIEYAQPTEGDGTSTVVGRVTFVVRAPDRSGVVTPELIAGYDTQVKLSLTNKGYIFTGDNIPVPPITGAEISVNGTFYIEAEDGDEIDIPVTNSDGDEVGNVTAGVGVEVPDATFTLVNTATPPATLDSGSIAAGVTGLIVAPPVTVLVNGQLFAVVPSGETEDVPVVNGGSNPVGAEQGGEWVIGNSEVFINSVQVADIVAEDSANLAVELDGVPAGTWNAGTQTWEVSSLPCPNGSVEINGDQVATVASGGMVNIMVEQDGNPVGAFDPNSNSWVIPSCPQDLTIRVQVALAADAFTFTATANEAGTITSVNDGGLSAFVLSKNATPVTAPFTIVNGDVISAAFTAAGAATTVILTGTY